MSVQGFILFFTMFTFIILVGVIVGGIFLTKSKLNFLDKLSDKVDKGLEMLEKNKEKDEQRTTK